VYIADLLASEVNVTNVASDLEKKLDQKRNEFRVERDRFVKLDQSYQQAKAELQLFRQENERLLARIRELERRPVHRHDLPSENDPAGSYHIVHGSTTLGGGHQDHYPTYEVTLNSVVSFTESLILTIFDAFNL
jgi:hypothetical protein